MKPTEKQLRFALFLLRKNGFRTDYFDSSFKELGLSMRERSGRCEAMSLRVCDKIIRALKNK